VQPPVGEVRNNPEVSPASAELVLPEEATDCANQLSGSFRGVRGGSFEDDAGPLLSTYPSSGDPQGETYMRRVRCARSP
jgi:formylglycine-generating enzyme required for sulfatase activity